MKALKTILFSTLSLALGAGSAVLAAPLFHRHGDPHAHMQAMWARDYPTLQSMSDDAEAVVLARVTRTMLGRVVPTTDEDVLPFTYVDLEVERVLRGTAGASITLEQTGGELDGRTLYSLDDGGPYTVGQRALLFLKQQRDTGLYYLSHPKGRYHVEDGLLHAVLPADPVARTLDLQPVGRALRLLQR